MTKKKRSPADSFRHVLREELAKLLEMQGNGMVEGLKLTLTRMTEKFDRMSIVFDGMAAAYDRERKATEKLIRRLEEHGKRLDDLEAWKRSASSPKERPL